MQSDEMGQRGKCQVWTQQPPGANPRSEKQPSELRQNERQTKRDRAGEQGDLKGQDGSSAERPKGNRAPVDRRALPEVGERRRSMEDTGSVPPAVRNS